MLTIGKRVLISTALAMVAGCGVSRDGSETSATPAERYALGLAQSYPFEARTAADVALAATSFAERRALGWRVAARVLEPVDVAGGTVPRFLTWYAKDDFRRIFRHAYEGLGRDGRRTRAPLTPDAITASAAWSASMVRTLPSWPPARLDGWLARLDDDALRQGLAGLGRTLYSPSAVQHLASEYRGVADCTDVADTSDPLAPPPSDDVFTLCFSREFPSDAAVIKTSWRRVDFGLTIPVYDTSAAAMTRRLGDSVSGWGAGDGETRLGADQIFTMRTEAGSSFQLVGLHVMSKEQRDWVWTSLWWSDTPRADFGEDRPEREWGVFGQYKMCVITTFDETAVVDPAMRARHPSLASALDAVVGATGAQSWCSNPYIEEGAHNHRSNCIGCHQHGGTRTSSADVLSDEARFPAGGRAQSRANFPADYLWSLGQPPEDLSSEVAEQLRYFDIYDLQNDTPEGTRHEEP